MKTTMHCVIPFMFFLPTDRMFCSRIFCSKYSSENLMRQFCFSYDSVQGCIEYLRRSTEVFFWGLPKFFLLKEPYIWICLKLNFWFSSNADFSRCCLWPWGPFQPKAPFSQSPASAEAPFGQGSFELRPPLAKAPFSQDLLWPRPPLAKTLFGQGPLFG